MKKKTKGFESYPSWIVFLSNLVTFSVYAAGIYLSYLIWPWLSLVFILLIIYNESSIYVEGCRHCYYYGKVCAFGRGKIAKLLVKKGDPERFCEKTVGFKDFILPSLPSILIVLAGIYLLITGFRWYILIITLWPLIVMFFLNSWIFGQLACPNCRQCSICCPVAEFFMKLEKKKQKKRKNR